MRARHKRIPPRLTLRDFLIDALIAVLGGYIGGMALWLGTIWWLSLPVR